MAQRPANYDKINSILRIFTKTNGIAKGPATERKVLPTRAVAICSGIVGLINILKLFMADFTRINIGPRTNSCIKKRT